MRNKAAKIIWKFANRLRDKYSPNRVVAAMITSIYLVWKAHNLEVENIDLINLINNTIDKFEEDFDKKQTREFQKSINLLQNEIGRLFDDEFFVYLTKAEEKELKELLGFLIKRTSEIDIEINDFTNREIADLFSSTLAKKQYEKVLDPCVGSGQLLVELAEEGVINRQEAVIHGIEKDSLVSFIAHINLKVNGFKNIVISTTDILKKDFNHHYDLIISDLPLGVRLRDRSFGGKVVPAGWRFYHLLFQKMMKQLTKTGEAYFTSSAYMIRDLNRYSNDEQVELQMFDNPNDYAQKLTKIIDASNFASWTYTGLPLYALGFENIMSHELQIIQIGDSMNDKETASITKSLWSTYGYISDPSFFLSDTFITIEQSEEDFIKLKNYFNFKTPKNKGGTNKDKAQVAVLYKKNLPAQSGWMNIADDHLQKMNANKVAFMLTKTAYPGDWLLMPSSKGFKLAYLDTSTHVHIDTNDVIEVLHPAFEFSELEKEWLKAELYSDLFERQIKAMSGYDMKINGTTLSNVLIPKLNEVEKQEKIKELREQRIKKLEREQEKLSDEFQDVLKEKEQEKLSEEFDLLHELHHSLKNDINAVKGAVDSIENYLKRKENLGTKINLEELVEKQRQGADPKLNDSVNERFDMIKSVTQGMSNLLNKYKEILKFDPKRQEKKWIVLKDFFEKHGKGYGKFNFEVRENIEFDTNKFDQKHYELYADPEVLRLVFQNIVVNAIEHGFTEDNRKYSLVVEIKESTGHDAKFKLPDGGIENFQDIIMNIIIKNDGNPILDEIDESEYFVREFSKSKMGSGIGGFHIKKGIEVIGGEVELIEPEESDPYQTQIHIKFSIQKGNAAFKFPSKKILTL